MLQLLFRKQDVSWVALCFFPYVPGIIVLFHGFVMELSHFLCGGVLLEIF